MFCRLKGRSLAASHRNRYIEWQKRRRRRRSDRRRVSRSTAGVEPQAGNAIELGLLARNLLGPFTLLVAPVEHLDLLELLESLAQGDLRVLELRPQVVG